VGITILPIGRNVKVTYKSLEAVNSAHIEKIHAILNAPARASPFSIASRAYFADPPAEGSIPAFASPSYSPYLGGVGKSWFSLAPFSCKATLK